MPQGLSYGPIDQFTGPLTTQKHYPGPIDPLTGPLTTQSTTPARNKGFQANAAK